MLLSQALCVMSFVLSMVYITRHFLPKAKNAVYLMDTFCYKPPDRLKVSRENYIRAGRLRKIWGEEALQFQEKLLNSSGLGDETYFPDSKPLVFVILLLVRTFCFHKGAPPQALHMQFVII